MVQASDLVPLLASAPWLTRVAIVGQQVVTESPGNLFQFLASIPWFAWVAIVAIISGTVSGYTAQIHRHRERMAMIQQGMNPDASGGKPAPPREF